LIDEGINTGPTHERSGPLGAFTPRSTPRQRERTRGQTIKKEESEGNKAVSGGRSVLPRNENITAYRPGNEIGVRTCCKGKRVRRTATFSSSVPAAR